MIPRGTGPTTVINESDQPGEMRFTATAVRTPDGKVQIVPWVPRAATIPVADADDDAINDPNWDPSNNDDEVEDDSGNDEEEDDDDDGEGEAFGTDEEEADEDDE
jgi:ribonuclease E